MKISDDSGRQGVALALQGGGVHGAYAWGVLDLLLQDGLEVGRVCGVSSGALLGVMLVQGLVKNGAAGARQEMARLWERVGQAHALSPLQGGPMDRWLSWGSEIGNSLMWQGMETALRMFSPSQLNPFNHNPLRAVIADLLDHDALCHPTALFALTVAATDVETGALGAVDQPGHHRGGSSRLLLPALRVPGGADRGSRLLGWRLFRQPALGAAAAP